MLEQIQSKAQIKSVNVAVRVNSANLPLSCPPRNMALWDMHPKVFLEIDHDQQALCPYCSTLYILDDE